MIYIDRAGHLVTDGDVSELHSFAQRLGLKRCWFQGAKQKHPHYDVTTDYMRNKAVKMGAVFVSSSQIVRILRRANGGE